MHRRAPLRHCIAANRIPDYKTTTRKKMRVRLLSLWLGIRLLLTNTLLDPQCLLSGSHAIRLTSYFNGSLMAGGNVPYLASNRPANNSALVLPSHAGPASSQNSSIWFFPNGVSGVPERPRPGDAGGYPYSPLGGAQSVVPVAATQHVGSTSTSQEPIMTTSSSANVPTPSHQSAPGTRIVSPLRQLARGLFSFQGQERSSLLDLSPFATTSSRNSSREVADHQSGGSRVVLRHEDASRSNATPVTRSQGRPCSKPDALFMVCAAGLSLGVSAILRLEWGSGRGPAQMYAGAVGDTQSASYDSVWNTLMNTPELRETTADNALDLLQLAADQPSEVYSVFWQNVYPYEEIMDFFIEAAYRGFAEKFRNDPKTGLPYHRLLESLPWKFFREEPVPLTGEEWSQIYHAWAKQVQSAGEMMNDQDDYFEVAGDDADREGDAEQLEQDLGLVVGRGKKSLPLLHEDGSSSSSPGGGGGTMNDSSDHGSRSSTSSSVRASPSPAFVTSSIDRLLMDKMRASNEYTMMYYAALALERENSQCLKEQEDNVSTASGAVVSGSSGKEHEEDDRPLLLRYAANYPPSGSENDGSAPRRPPKERQPDYAWYYLASNWGGSSALKEDPIKNNFFREMTEKMIKKHALTSPEYDEGAVCRGYRGRMSGSAATTSAGPGTRTVEETPLNTKKKKPFLQGDSGPRDQNHDSAALLKTTSTDSFAVARAWEELKEKIVEQTRLRYSGLIQDLRSEWQFCCNVGVTMANWLLTRGNYAFQASEQNWRELRRGGSTPKGGVPLETQFPLLDLHAEYFYETMKRNSALFDEERGSRSGTTQGRRDENGNMVQVQPQMDEVAVKTPLEQFIQEVYSSKKTTDEVDVEREDFTAFTVVVSFYHLGTGAGSTEKFIETFHPPHAAMSDLDPILADESSWKTTTESILDENDTAAKDVLEQLAKETSGVFDKTKYPDTLVKSWPHLLTFGRVKDQIFLFDQSAFLGMLTKRKQGADAVNPTPQELSSAAGRVPWKWRPRLVRLSDQDFADMFLDDSVKTSTSTLRQEEEEVVRTEGPPQPGRLANSLSSSSSPGKTSFSAPVNPFLQAPIGGSAAKLERLWTFLAEINTMKSSEPSRTTFSDSALFSEEKRTDVEKEMWKLATEAASEDGYMKLQDVFGVEASATAVLHEPGGSLAEVAKNVKKVQRLKKAWNKFAWNGVVPEKALGITGVALPFIQRIYKIPVLSSNKRRPRK
ncbi:unnamed protein product [Amoebophrya sp. A120]|nr:unnamed protein product [Amoebophrya sp. A120]|eukprot:GSA120T00009476001.1